MDCRRREILEWMDGHREELVALSGDLISIPTVSSYPDAKEQYQRLNAYLIRKGSLFGLQHTLCQNGNAGQNLILKLPGSGGGKSLAIGGHADVVPAEEDGWGSGSGFSPWVQDGRLYGRGAADMKCGLTAAFLAMRALAENRVPLKGDLLLIASVDEEIGGSDGMKFLAETGKVRPDYFINAEQTGLDVMTRYKGVCHITVTVSGRSAHGSMPYSGVNAIEGAAAMIEAVCAGTRMLARDSVLGEPTVNVGLIRGGTARNIVADKCTFTLDVRMVRGQTSGSVLEDIRRITGAEMEKRPGLVVQTEVLRATECVEIPESDPLVSALIRNGAEIGRTMRCGSYISAGDCWHLLKKGHTALMCGPGNVSEIHRANEFVTLSEVLEAAKLYALTAMDICGR